MKVQGQPFFVVETRTAKSNLELTRSLPRAWRSGLVVGVLSTEVHRKGVCLCEVGRSFRSSLSPPMPVHDPGRGYHACMLDLQWPHQYERAYLINQSFSDRM